MFWGCASRVDDFIEPQVADDAHLILLVSELEVFATCVRFRKVLETIRYWLDRDRLRILDREGDTVDRPDGSHAVFSGPNCQMHVCEFAI